MPSLGDLVQGLDARVLGDAGVPVLDVAYDSRDVAEGSLFVALRGAKTDGHRFLAEAAEAGASSLLVEELPSPAPEGVAIAIVPDTRTALAAASAALLDHPGRRSALGGGRRLSRPPVRGRLGRRRLHELARPRLRA